MHSSEQCVAGASTRGTDSAVRRRHPGRPQRPATHRATPTRPCRPNPPTTTRRATRRPGYQRKRALAAAARHRSPRYDCGFILAGTSGKVDQPHPGRLRCHPLLRSAAAAGPLPDDHPAAALWWRILDQLPQTSNQDHANPEAIPAASRMTPRPFDQRPPVPRLAPPPAFGPSR